LQRNRGKEEKTTFEIKRRQKVFKVGKVSVGGRPGEYPTVLIGSIFHEGQKIVKDSKKGVFDKELAETLLNKQDELSEKTGVPYMLDVTGLSQEALKKHVDFVSKVTEAPILIDGPTPEIRISATKYAVEIGLRDRIIYNSISSAADEKEISAIRETGIDSAVILAFSSSHILPEQKIKLLKGRKREEGLLEKASKAGIKKPLVDVAVLDVPSIGLAIEAIWLVKNRLGLPAGSAPCNSMHQWKRVKEFGKSARNTCLAAMGVVTQMAGADFILYGSISKAETVFPAVAMTDAIIAYNMKWAGIKPKVKDHPIFKIF